MASAATQDVSVGEAARPRRELTSLELAARLEAQITAAGNSIGVAMTRVSRGCSDEDVIEGLHEAVNALTTAVLDAHYLQEQLG